MVDVYSADDDPASGGSHHDPNTTANVPYSSSQDASVGGQTGGDKSPSNVMNRQGIVDRAGSWLQSVTGATAPHLPGTSGPQPVFSQPVDSHLGAGFVRGMRDVGDKIAEAPNPEYGYTPTADDLTTIKQQNANDRAAFDQKYGNDASANAGRMAGNFIATAPVLGPVGELAGVGLRMLPQAVTGARGLLGIGARAGERLFSGGVGGGTQAALTSDPSQPLGPQVGEGTTVGGLFHAGVGAVSDVLSNIVRRLSGSTVRVDPYTGNVPDVDIERARQATLLQHEGVPLQASQISNDPYLQFSNKVGSQAPGSGSTDFLNNQTQTFRNVALQHAEPGTPASLATPNFIQNSDTRIGQMYDNSIRAVPSIPSIGPSGLTIDREFGRIRQTIPSSMTPEAQAQVNGAMNDVEDAFRQQGGAISGGDAQRLTRSTASVVSPLLNSADPDVRRFGMQIREQINQRARAQMTPQQQATFDQANGQFRALRTLESAADSDGSFTPGALHNEAQEVARRFNSPGTLDELARAGNTVIQPTLDGRGLFGKVTGTAGPIGAGLAASAVLKPALDWAMTGGSGTAIGAGGLLLNRGVQALNRLGGDAAINATLAPGGGASVADIMRALDMLRRPVVSSQQRS